MQDWMLVLIIGAVVIFGAAKLPQIARNMGKAQGEFKKGLKEGAVDDEPASPPAAAPPAAAPPAAAPPAAAPEQAQQAEGDTPSA
jgi:TatA/E family protein of Tat protein translocase